MELQATPADTASHPQTHLVRFNKAGTLDGEVNLELPDIEEREVEVRRLTWGACAVPRYGLSPA